MLESENFVKEEIGLKNMAYRTYCSFPEAADLVPKNAVCPSEVSIRQCRAEKGRLPHRNVCALELL